MGSYKIEFKRSAECDIRRYPALPHSQDPRRSGGSGERPVASSIAEALRDGEHLPAADRDRVIYSVDSDTKTVVVYYVRHRREAYRQL